METQEWEAFDERFSPDWWRGFGTTEDIDGKGIEGIKAFIKENFVSRAEIEKVCEEMKMKEHPCLKDEDYPHDDCISGKAHMEGYNTALSDLRRRLIETS